MNAYARINAMGLALAWPGLAAAVLWWFSAGEIDWRGLAAAAVVATGAMLAAEWRLVRAGEWFRSGFALTLSAIAAVPVAAVVELGLRHGLDAVRSEAVWSGWFLLAPGVWGLVLLAPVVLPPLHLGLHDLRVSSPLAHGLAGAAVAASLAGLYGWVGGPMDTPALAGLAAGGAIGACLHAVLMRGASLPRAAGVVT